MYVEYEFNLTNRKSVNNAFKIIKKTLKTRSHMNVEYEFNLTSTKYVENALKSSKKTTLKECSHMYVDCQSYG